MDLIHKFNKAIYKRLKRFYFFRVLYSIYSAKGAWRSRLLRFMRKHKGFQYRLIHLNNKTAEISSNEYCFKVPISAVGLKAIHNEYAVKKSLEHLADKAISDYYDHDNVLIEDDGITYLRMKHLHDADTAAKDAFVPVWAQLLMERSHEVVLSESLLRERFSHYDEILALYRLNSKLPEDVYNLDGLTVHMGFCHGDLHEDNIMCNDDGKITLIDFEETSFDGFVELEIFQYVLYRLRKDNPKIRMEVATDVFFGEEYTIPEVSRFGNLFRKDLLFLYILTWENRFWKS